MKFLRAEGKGFDRYLSEVEGRITQDGPSFDRRVWSILEDVRKQGDKALVRYTRVFDGVGLSSHQLQLKPGEIRQAYRKVPEDLLVTLRKAARRIE